MVMTILKDGIDGGRPVPQFKEFGECNAEALMPIYPIRITEKRSESEDQEGL